MSIEEAMGQQRVVLAQEMDAWDLDGFVARLGKRIAAEQKDTRPARRTRAPKPPRPVPARPKPSRPGRTQCAPPVSSPLLSDEEELQQLCEDAVTVPEVKSLLERFLTECEPSGARVFACLLYLANRAEHALFWWRFASGAEDGRAAYFMTLHSRSRGQDLQINTWAEYTRELDFDPEQHWPEPDSDCTITADTRRLSDCVQAHLRAESLPDPRPQTILLPTCDLPTELVSL
jgi:hypothetical protein